MRSSTRCNFIVLNYTLLAFIFLLYLPMGSAQTEWVIKADGTGDFTSFSSALANASVVNGDILKVEGTITEQGINVNKNLTIKGEGQGLSIVQANAARNTGTDRVFLVAANQTVTFEDLTIQHGHLGPGTTPVGNFYGAGIHCANGSNVSLMRVTVQNNDIRSDDGLTSPGGGGIYAGDNVTLYIEESLITNNYSHDRGGGIALGNSSIGDNIDCDIVNSTISNNIANLGENGADGGAIYTQIRNSSLDIIGSLLAGNQAGDDGGAIAMLGSLEGSSGSLINSTVTGNECGAGATRAQGGGINLNTRSFDIINSTIVNNTLLSRDNDIGDEEGAGLYYNDSFSPSINIINSIITNNTQHDGSSEDVFMEFNLTTNTRNLISTCTGDVTCPSFYLTSGANLENLADNGGPTMTHALMANSSAINEGTTGGSVPADDQRGYIRNVGAPDIGAYEFGASPPVAPEPEMLVEDADGTEIIDGDDSPSAAESTDFGTANIDGGSVVRTFTIKNTGGADLNLTGMPNAITISGSAAFMISAQAGSTTIPGPSGSITFEVTFDPNDNDCSTQTATVSIANNDSDENPYTFDVQGTPVDNIDPSITCPADITTNNDPGECYAQPLFSASGSDNCGFTLGYTQLSGTQFPVGTTTVTATATDGAGNTSTCTFDVTVNDTENPTAVCFNPTITFSGEAEIMLQPEQVWDEASSTDNCGPLSLVSITPDVITCDQSGSVVPVTVVIQDGEGNTGECTANVTVSGLPCGFTAPPDGINCAGGSQAAYDPNTDTYTVTSEGCYDPNYYSNSDSQGYVGTELCGDGEIIALVTQVDGNGFAGISMREDLTAGSKMLQLSIDGVMLTKRKLRQSTGGFAYNHQFQTQGKNWLRLTRTGSQFAAYHSFDGINWMAVIVVNIAMTNCIEIGLFTENNMPTGSVTGTFENVEIKGGMTTLSTPGAQPGAEQAVNLAREVSIYPNPAEDIIDIQLAPFADQKVQITVYNILGQPVKQKQVQRVENHTERMNVHDLRPGTYLVEIGNADDKVVVKKLVVARQ